MQFAKCMLRTLNVTNQCLCVTVLVNKLFVNSSAVCELMEGRSLEQCKEQWNKFEDINHPIKRGKWEPEEDEVSLILQRITITLSLHNHSEVCCVTLIWCMQHLQLRLSTLNTTCYNYQAKNLLMSLCNFMVYWQWDIVRSLPLFTSLLLECGKKSRPYDTSASCWN